MASVTKTERQQAVFGCFDGLTSLVGLLAGCLVAHASGAAVLTESGGLAVAAAVGMASGDYLSGSGWRLAGVMGVATLVGSLLPAVPVALMDGRPAGYGIGVAVALVLAMVIAETRSATGVGRLVGYVSTGAVLLVASGLSVAASVLLGTVG